MKLPLKVNIPSHKIMIWKTRRQTLDLSQGGIVMGILNATPDSFSDGGRYSLTHQALGRAMEMVEEGARIIDIGGESTRPGAKKVSLQEELARVIPVIKAIRAQSNIPISIDTTKALVAEAAIAAGADIINDISAFNMDPDMKDVALKTGAGCILMHMRGTPQTMQSLTDYNDLILEIKNYFAELIAKLTTAGIKRECLMIDPGIGFSKTLEQNLLLIKHLDQFLDLNQPILLGPSRKSFIAKTLNTTDIEDLKWGTAAAITLGIAKGAAAVRVHDTSEMYKVAKISDSIVTS